jgi:peptide/nickel transport system permease protein
VWSRYRKDRVGMIALAGIALLASIALGAPFIAGKRPIACRYKGEWYFPVTFHYTGRENPAFFLDPDGLIFKRPYGEVLAEDADSFAIWPVVRTDPLDPSGDEANLPPGSGHPFGTDSMGRDVFARIVHGTSTALLVGLLSMGIATAIGIIVGGLAGGLGGWVDLVLSRLIDLTMSIPSIILVLFLVAVLEKPTIWHVMAAIGLTRWESIARYVRAEFLRLREAEFVLAARALGASRPRIMVRYLLPNSLAPVIVAMSFGIAGAILLESSLSFVGVGVDPLRPSWGAMLDEGCRGLFKDVVKPWWLIAFPGLAVFLAVLIYNLAGDAFQEAGDPRRRGR